jgi:hypothetical protein
MTKKDAKVYAAEETEEVDDLKHQLAVLNKERNELALAKQKFELENAGLKTQVSVLSGNAEKIPEPGLDLLPKRLLEIVPPEEKTDAGGINNIGPSHTQKLMQRVLVASTATKPLAKVRDANFSAVPSYILHQNHPYKVRWDVLLAAMIIYSVITVPLRIAFGTEARGVSLALDIIIDLFFFADICASFRTTYIDPETHEYVTDPIKIAKHYSSSWFTIDFVSTLPIDRIAESASSGGGGNLRMIKLIRVLRLVRLLKLMKLMKFGDILDQYENYLPVSRGVLHIFGMLIQITFVAHLMGCVWYALGAMDCHGDVSDPSTKNDACTWLKVYFGDVWNKGHCQDSDGSIIELFGMVESDPHGFHTSPLHCESVDGYTWMYAVPLERRYTAAIYWAVTTMATVGYGDINTQNDSERAFAVFAMCVGASAFGYTIGIISDLVQNSDIVAVEKKAKLANFVNYSTSLRLPYKLHKRIKKHWAYLCKKEGVFPQHEMLAYMPLELQRDTIKTKGGAYRELCLQVEGLLTKGPGDIRRTPKFVLAVIPKLIPLFCKGGDVLFEEFMVGWHCYWIISGDVKMELMVDGAQVLWKEVGPGARFGENFVTNGTVAQYTATAVEEVPGDDIEMTSLDREDVHELAKIFPELLDELFDGAEACALAVKSFKSTLEAHERAKKDKPEDTSSLHESHQLTEADLDKDREKGIFHNIAAGKLWSLHKMVHPETMRKIQWDLFVGFLILWSVIIVPMRIAFNVEPEGSMMIFDSFIDICFAIDLLMSFRTAYFTSHRELVYDSKRVYKHYMCGWFFVDFVTTFPIDRLAAAFVSNPSQLRSIKMLRVLRLARLAKIAKILQNGPMFELFEDITAGINPSIFRLMMLFLQMFFCAHMIGCVWHYVCNFGDVGNTWVSSYYIGHRTAHADDDVSEFAPFHVGPWATDSPTSSPTGLPTSSPTVSNFTHAPTFMPTNSPTAASKEFTDINMQSRYLTSIYWALATMTTVGYGDISANSEKESEMVVAMLSMLFGTTIFAYVIGEVVMAVLNFNPAEKELARKKRSLKKYIEHHKLAPKGAGIDADEEPDLDHIESADMAARKGLMHYVEMTSVFNTVTLFKRTPEFLQRQIITFHYEPVIANSGMLQVSPPPTITTTSHPHPHPHPQHIFHQFGACSPDHASHFSVPFFSIQQKLENMFPGMLGRLLPILHPILVSPQVDIVQKGERISSM